MHVLSQPETMTANYISYLMIFVLFEAYIGLHQKTAYDLKGRVTVREKIWVREGHMTEVMDTNQE